MQASRALERAGADEWEVYVRSVDLRRLEVTNRKVRSLERKQSVEVGVRLAAGGRLAGVALSVPWSDIPAALEDVAGELVHFTRYGPEWNSSFARGRGGTFLQPEDAAWGKEWLDLSRGCAGWFSERMARFEELGEMTVSLRFRTVCDCMLTSWGFVGERGWSEHSCALIGTVCDSEGFDRIHKEASGRGVLLREEERERLLECWRVEVERSRRVVRWSPPSGGGKMRVLVAPDFVSCLRSVLLAGVDAEACRRGLSPLAGREGERIFDERFSMVEDPRWEKGMRRLPFDDEGTPTFRAPIFERGVFVGARGTREECMKYGIPPTGNGYRARVDRPVFSAGSLRFPPGSAAEEELWTAVGEGVLLVASYDCWMGNTMNGDFRGTLHLGYVVKDGRIAGRLKNATVAGNIYTIFGSGLIEVGDRVHPVNGASWTEEAPFYLVEGVSVVC